MSGWVLVGKVAGWVWRSLEPRGCWKTSRRSDHGQEDTLRFLRTRRNPEDSWQHQWLDEEQEVVHKAKLLIKATTNNYKSVLKLSKASCLLTALLKEWVLSFSGISWSTFCVETSRGDLIFTLCENLRLLPTLQQSRGFGCHKWFSRKEFSWPEILALQYTHMRFWGLLEHMTTNSTMGAGRRRRRWWEWRKVKGAALSFKMTSLLLLALLAATVRWFRMKFAENQSQIIFILTRWNLGIICNS